MARRRIARAARLLAVAGCASAWLSPRAPAARGIRPQTATMTPEERIAAMDAQEGAAKDVTARSEQDGLPLSMVVGQDSIKTALLLASVNRDMGGVLISGGRGTAKSVMARALHSLLPPIEVVKDSKYNADPENVQEIDSLLRKQLEAMDDGKKVTERLADLDREIIKAPFVQIPLNVMDDMSAAVSVFRLPALLMRLQDVDARRLRERRSWVVSF